MAKILTTAAFAAATLAALSASPAGAASYVLDFSGNICNGGGACANNSSIDMTYGDVAGQVDVIYDPDANAPGTSPLYWWNFYSGMPAVAWGNSGATVEIFLSPAAGYSITLVSFNLGSYLNANRTTRYEILTGTGTQLAIQDPLVVGAAPFLYNTSHTSNNGIRIQWGPDGYDVGIDNINFEVNRITGTIPEPGTWAMLLGGMALVGLTLRRRGQVRVSFG